MSLDIQRYLQAGELVLWEGRPPQGIRLRLVDALLIPFSLLIGGFFLFAGAASLFAIFLDLSNWYHIPTALVMLFVGTYFTIGRLIHDAAIRRRTIYFVTNQRVLIMRNRRSNMLVHSLNLRQLSGVELQEKRSNRGTIVFEPLTLISGNHDIWVPALVLNRFHDIENPRQVYELIMQTARAA